MQKKIELLMKKISSQKIMKDITMNIQKKKKIVVKNVSYKLINVLKKKIYDFKIRFLKHCKKYQKLFYRNFRK